MLGCVGSPAAGEFEMPSDRPSAELADLGRSAEIRTEIDAAGEHPHAAFRRGQQRRLTPRQTSSGIPGQDERGPVELAPRFVVTGMAIAAHEQMRQAIVLDREVHANLLTAK